MTQNEVYELMNSSKKETWNANCDKVKAAHGGMYPSYWYQEMVLSGMAARILSQNQTTTMHREVKFRGKRTDNGEWVYGNVNYLQDGVFILEHDQHGCIEQPDYHCQGMGCGLEDRNITDRYEAMEHGWEKAIEQQGELLPLFIEVDPETVGQYTGTNDKESVDAYEHDITDEGVIVFHEKYLGFFIQDKKGELTPLYDVPSFEILGSIHDNPELINQK